MKSENIKVLIKHILITLLISIILYEFQKFTKSDYILQFLSNNLITIIVALLAINTTTLGIVFSKINDIPINTTEAEDSLKNASGQMKNSIYEQLILVLLSIILFTLFNAQFINCTTYLKIGIDIFCIAIFVYDLILLYDTSKSIFIIFDNKTCVKKHS